jgi:hypothetical protein
MSFDMEEAFEEALSSVTKKPYQSYQMEKQHLPHAQCWRFKNQTKPPNTSEKIQEQTCKRTQESKTKNLWKSVLSLKVVNPFTHSLGLPFIGRRRDFYIPKFPSDLKNI